MVAATDIDSALLSERYRALRASSEALIEGLSAEDCNLQAMADTSPAKWHLAHTTWFFETFVLKAGVPGYQPLNELYELLFNSYYNGVGRQYPRPQRGLLTRPSLADVLEYRRHVDDELQAFLVADPEPLLAGRIELGLHHEAQHQELLLTDLKYGLFQNPLLPAYRDAAESPAPAASQLNWIGFAGGEVTIGHRGADFAFDNESPAHPVLLAPYRLSSRLVTNAEFLDFIEDGGYENPDHWLSDGWTEVQGAGLAHPLYWGRIDGQWLEYTLCGLRPLDPGGPVSHLSYFEAQAYASWAGRRLPTETEWEAAAADVSVTGNFLDGDTLRPAAAPEGDGVQQLFGDCWEWTQSAYLPYPGFRPAAGAIGEYNGKFMSGQMVLRGGSCLSQQFHIRPSYRNFFYARDRWQCTGLRLADDG